MTKRLTLAALAALLLTALALPAMAQGPSFTAIDTEVSTWLPAVEDFQFDYLASHGRYYQMLWSHTEAPHIDQPAVPDYLGTGPNDQNETGYDLWLEAGLPSLTAYRLKVDTYRGLAGPGYVLVLQTRYNDDLWQRTINYGPDSYRGHDWALIPVELLP